MSVRRFLPGVYMRNETKLYDPLRSAARTPDRWRHTPRAHLGRFRRRGARGAVRIDNLSLAILMRHRAVMLAAFGLLQIASCFVSADVVATVLLRVGASVGLLGTLLGLGGAAAP